jgi:hypothetical protein
MDPNTPSEYICPLSAKVFKDPVTAADGNTYDRKAFVKWVEDKDTSPITGEEMLHTDYEPDFVLAMGIEDWKRRTGQPVDLESDSGSEDDEDLDGKDMLDDERGRDPQKKVDRKALDNLYASTRGDQCWENIDGWDEGTNNLDEW